MTARTNEQGVALISALLVLMLMSAMLAGFIVMVNADAAAGGIHRDSTQAYAAAHGGVEKLTADLGQVFNGNFSPTGDQLDALTTPAMEPDLPGISFLRPNGTSGYRITFADGNGDGNPDVADANGTPIGTGPYQGLVGLITPYQVEVTARTQGNAEVRMRRTMQTIAIPVFQFGIFSENNLSYFAGPNFSFGGRVHTNQHLFLKQDNGATLTLRDRVTSVGEVIRNYLSNGVSGTHDGTVRMSRAAGCPAAPAAANGSCFNLLNTQSSVTNQGSLNATLVAAQADKDNDTALALNPQWTGVSLDTSDEWLRNWRTGAKRLDLPIVSDGASPVDLIRRPPVGEAANGAIGQQRFYNMATLRILISDRFEDLVGPPAALPGVVFTAAGATASPVRLRGTLTPPAGIAGVNGSLPATPYPLAASNANAATGYRTTAGTSGIDGWILINRQDRDGNWTDVTWDILSLGFSGRRLSTGAIDNPDDTAACGNYHLNSVVRFQRPRDTGGAALCAPANPPLAQLATDFWPNVLYDAREGMLRDDENARPQAGNPSNVAGVAANQQRLYWGGVMHYVELDINNLRRWIRGEIGATANNSAACLNGAGPTTCPMDVTGFVVYFSDRRGNRNFGADGVPAAGSDANGPTFGDDLETGELGFEDIINTTATSAPNNALDHQFEDAQGDDRWAEDVNESGTLQVYGGTARLVSGPIGAMINPLPNASYTPVGGLYNLFTTPIDRNVARVNRAFFFRRALKLINGGRGNLPANGSQGLTVASENPVYVQGHFNACNNILPTSGADNWALTCVGAGFGNVPGNDHVSAAVIADSVTLLSNRWNDIRSFLMPNDAAYSTAPNSASPNQNRRLAATTWYRLGIIGGKGLSFPRASVAPTARDHTDFGTDGGAHNFLRYIENWGGQTLNYRGSLISFYTSRQAVGTYKCCSNVYSPPSRGYVFDAEFLNPNLLPPRTPMFRDINTLTFRQILRPTQ
ncbi:MAG: hypothetical protein LC791_13965 [Acidobacteria bacterium]|nr:hypothetical protein [Acidobacteriota bacterium]